MKNLKTIFLFLSFLAVAGMLITCTPRGSKITITARDVVDEDSLRDFVLAAKDYLEGDYVQAVVDFRQESRWRYGAIYLFSIKKSDGKTLFHVETPEFVGQRIRLIDADTGRDVIDQFRRVGSRPEGGFVEYKYDNPETRERDRTLKISYVISFIREGREDYIVGAGFHPEDY